ncbi:transcriptional regulator [Arcticibacter sp.]|jgi:DNA-binding transcriptional regulator YhcF (GntR family)|uniref:transcriptional regulator n=1 Tax=Arcticibacter sp. TaxID=1872630 RepID=UPI00388DDFF1
MLFIDPKDKLPKVTQIVQGIVRDIEKGLLKKNDRLLSITDFSKKHKIARDTVERAYKKLKEEGYIISVPGKGNYIDEVERSNIKILMILNKLSSYKKDVYESFIKTLGRKAKVDLQVHHYDPKMLKEILDGARGKYHYYVIMPHFFQHVDKKELSDILRSVPAHELVLLDKNVSLDFDGYIAVYQDFRKDIYDALRSASDLVDKYSSITILFPEHRNHPAEITDGIRQFCQEYNKHFSIVSDVGEIELVKRHIYITLTDSDLASLIKSVRAESLSIGEDIGIISFNETALKELLDITVITTDFAAMGKTTARLILNKEFAQVHNPFKIIKRQSL